MERKGLIICVVLFFIFSCQPSGKEKNNFDNISSIILDEQIDNPDTNSLRTVYYRFPSPEDMLHYINNEKLEYVPELLNPYDYSKKYIGSKSQSLNLGVYISELAYVTMFKKINQAANYLAAVNHLSEELLISPNNSSKLESRIKKNLNNIDSLMVITRDSYNDLVKYLTDTQNEQTLALITTGAYVEALHLTLNQINQVSPENPLIKKIFEQKYALDNLYLYLIEHGGEKNNDIVIYLKTIKTKLDEIRIVKLSKTEVIQEDDELIFAGGKIKIEITREQFEDVKKTVSRIREKIVQI